MGTFRKYMHIERFGSDGVEGIELGGCYIFPKLDGTNASVWFDDGIRAGSRTRELTLDADNAGFYKYAIDDEAIGRFFDRYPTHRLYGEFLVPHSLRTYRDDAWRKFYVFDVYDDEMGGYSPYEDYADVLEFCGIDYVTPLCTMKNATYENLLVELENNKFLIQEGRGAGEGLVIKNYNYVNKFGHVVWAKLVSNLFKEKHVKAMGPTAKNMKEMVEQVITDEYVSKHLVDKVHAKIMNEYGGWNSRRIPQFLQTVFYDLVNEELWDIVKKFKNPTINFKTLSTLTTMRIKELKPELF